MFWVKREPKFSSFEWFILYQIRPRRIRSFTVSKIWPNVWNYSDEIVELISDQKKPKKGAQM